MRPRQVQAYRSHQQIPLQTPAGMWTRADTQTGYVDKVGEGTPCELEGEDEQEGGGGEELEVEVLERGGRVGYLRG
jgi:hypothetical protein